MRAFAEKTFELDAQDKDGFSPRVKLQGLIERTRDADKRREYEAELACPPFPDELTYLWNAFHRLSMRRGSNGFGPNPISWPEMDAFIRHSRLDLKPWEIRLIEQLDDLYRIEMAKSKSTKEN